MKKYSLKKSRGRKYTRRRNIRKYKKNQKGGKTTKRRSLEKRRGKTKTRRMRGGYQYRFRVNTDKLKKYIESEYSMELSKLELAAYGVIGITNRSKGFFLRADHRQEQISVFACYENNSGQPAFYAIARCVNSCPENLDKSYFERKPTETPNFEMESKILFLKPENLRKIDLQNTKDTKTQKALELLKQKLRDKNFSEIDINNLTNDIPCYEFENSFSSTDNYRIVIFPGRVVTTNQNLENLFSSIQQSIEKRTPFTPEVVSYPDVTQQQQIQSTTGDSSLSAVDVVVVGNIFNALLSALLG